MTGWFQILPNVLFTQKASNVKIFALPAKWIKCFNILPPGGGDHKLFDRRGKKNIAHRIFMTPYSKENGSPYIVHSNQEIRIRRLRRKELGMILYNGCKKSCKLKLRFSWITPLEFNFSKIQIKWKMMTFLLWFTMLFIILSRSQFFWKFCTKRQRVRVCISKNDDQKQKMI